MIDPRTVETWPPGAGLEASVGYILARCVPVADLPGGLRELRAAFGWGPPGDGLRDRDARRRVRRWSTDAQALFPQLGLHPALAALNDRFGDGRVHGQVTIGQALADAGLPAGFALAPLHQLISWSAGPPAWTVWETGGHRFVGPLGRWSRRLLLRTARHLLHDRGVVPITALRQALIAEAGDLLDPDLTDPEITALAELSLHMLYGAGANDAAPPHGHTGSGNLAALGDPEGGWCWLPDDTTSVLAVGLRRLTSVLGPVPLEVVGPAVARQRHRTQTTQATQAAETKSEAGDGLWPLPAGLIHAWVDHHQPPWTLRNDPSPVVAWTGPRPSARPADWLLARAALDGPQRVAALHAVLTARGWSQLNAALIVHQTPILRRIDRGRYALAYAPDRLGPRPRVLRPAADG